MRALILLTLIALQGAALVSPPSEPSDLSFLQHRLDLATTGEVFLSLASNDVKIWIRNLELKSVPASETARVGPDSLRISRVSTLEPVSEIKEVIELVEEIDEDTTGVVSSLEETVGLEDMASNYCVYLEDGSVLIFRGGEFRGLAEWFRWKLMRGKAATAYLRDRIRGNEAKFIELDLTGEGAREIFWVLRQGTPVIF